MEQSPGAGGSITHNLASAHRPTEAGPQDDTMDEGELSEGELEDIYEPKYPNVDPAPIGSNVLRNQALPTNGSGVATKAPVPQDELEPGLSGE